MENNGNAIWQLSFDSMYKNLFRISGNFIIDELILDKEEVDRGKDNGLGLSFKFSCMPINIDDLLLYFSYINIGTNTYRHELGTNNFVIKGTIRAGSMAGDGFEV